jgi:hypothetical protein
MNDEQSSRGAGLMVIVAALAMAALGSAFDIVAGGAGRFWTLAEPGVRAALGAGVAVIAALLGYGARMLLHSPPPPDGAP